MVRRIVMLGAPASGKGTQAARLALHFDLPNLSTGALIRAEQKRGSNLGKLADRYLEGGGFLPDELIGELMGAWLGEEGAGGFVLDGFPRTGPQALTFDSILASSGQKLDAAILLEADLETLQGRLAGRLHCPVCGGTFQRGALEQGGRCPQAGCIGQVVPRSDDQPGPFAGRLGNYHSLTEPLIEHYNQLGVLRRVDGRAQPDEVFSDILARLGPPIPTTHSN